MYSTPKKAGSICSILAYPFKPNPLKNVPNGAMVPLQVLHVGEVLRGGEEELHVLHHVVLL